MNIIVAQPASVQVTQGASATFSVGATGSDPLSYQWFFNGTPIGSNAPNLILTEVQSGNAGRYSVLVNNAVGSIVSAEALLIVNQTPAITSVTWGAQGNSGLSETFHLLHIEGGGLASRALRNGNLVRIGTFNLTDDQIQEQRWDLNSLNTSFIEYATAAIGDGGFSQDSGKWSKVSSQSTDALGINGHRIYIWAFNAPFIAGTSQHGIFSSSNPSWIFPSDSSVPNTTTIDLAQVNNIVVGDFGVRTETSSLPDSNFDLVPIVDPPTIIVEPLSQQVTVRSTVEFTVVANSFAPLTYQWFRTGGGPIPGANSASLTFFNVGLGDAGLYYVKVSNAAGSVLAGAQLIVTIPPPPPLLITVTPQNQTVEADSSVSFSVTATGTPPFNYRWFHNGELISGAISSEPLGTPVLTLTHVRPIDSGDYTVLVHDTAGKEQTSTATLTVLPRTPPTITQQPESQSVAIGAIASFAVSATGTAPLSYQWFRNGQTISGATSPTYTIASVQSADAGDYTVQVSNSAGTVTSAAANLSVITPPMFVVQPSSQQVIIGSTVTLSVVANGSGPLSYQWFKNGQAMPGATSASFPLVNVQPVDSGDYFVSVNNAAGSTQSMIARLVVSTQAPPVIIVQPVSMQAGVGASASFFVNAIGTEPLNYQWLFNGNPVGLNGSNLMLTGIQPSNAGRYAVLVSNALGTVMSAQAELIVIVPLLITATPQNLTVEAESVVSFSVSASGTPPLNYQWLHNGAVIAGATSSQLSLAHARENDSGDYTVRVRDGAGAEETRTATLTVRPLTPPTITQQPQLQNVRTGVEATFLVTAEGSKPLSFQWFHRGKELPGATQATYSIQTVQESDAGEYSVRVSNAAGSVMSQDALLIVGLAPVITTQPVGQSVNEGAPAFFSVANTGSGPLSYQWQRDGTAIVGANKPQFLVNATKTSDAGPYGVIVRNDYGEARSEVANLLVRPPDVPPVTLVRSFRRLENGQFQLEIEGPLTGRYEIKASSNLVDWSPITAVSNSAGRLTFEDPAAQGQPQRFYYPEFLP